METKLATQNGRFAEVLGAVSIAADLGAGQPPETAMGASVLAVRIGRKLGLTTAELSDLYFATVVRFLGCTSTSPEASRLGAGDDAALLYSISMCDALCQEELAASMRERVAPNASAAEREGCIEALRKNQEGIIGSTGAAHCAQALVLIRRLDFSSGVADLVSHMYDRWDGKAGGLAGADIPLGARIINVAVAVELVRRALGTAAALDVARTRSGGQLDPEIAELLIGDAPALFSGLGVPVLWDLFLDNEPDTPRLLRGGDIARVAEVLADFADQKSCFSHGHSRRVAALCFLAAGGAGLGDQEREQLRLAALMHDVGRVGVPAGIWDVPREISAAERRAIEQHAHHTSTVLSQTPILEPIAILAAQAHERADGTGYPHRGRADQRGAGLLAAADMFEALTHDRPWRSALKNGAASDVLLQEAKDQRLPRRAVAAVLEAAGQRRNQVERALPASLSKREAEILSLLGRGHSNKEIATKLCIATKTAENHVQNIYEKTGARGRAAAALYAVEHGLFDD